MKDFYLYQSIYTLYIATFKIRVHIPPLLFGACRGHQQAEHGAAPSQSKSIPINMLNSEHKLVLPKMHYTLYFNLYTTSLCVVPNNVADNSFCCFFQDRSIIERLQPSLATTKQDLKEESCKQGKRTNSIPSPHPSKTKKRNRNKGEKY